MEEINFTCRTITPLVMTGANGKTPELRPPGIKASLRYWWRALHGHLSLKKLRKLEGEIFGDNSKRSNLLIKVMQNENPNVDKTALLPHKSEHKAKSFTRAFLENQEFEIRICFSERSIGKGDNQIQLDRDYVKDLFILACTLGGWGKRSRRGFGSIEVTEINGSNFDMSTNLNGILAILNTLVEDKYTIHNNNRTIEWNSTQSNNSEEYPRLLQIQIGEEVKSFTQINQATHDVKISNPQGYSNSVGSGRPRLASPIFISMLPNEIPIISTLEKPGRVNTGIQTELKDLILQ